MKEKKNTDKKTKFRPNVLDFLIVLVILGAIIGIGIRSGVVEKIITNSNATPARISFIAENISSASYDFFVKDEAFYSKTLGCYVGTLESTSSMPAKFLQSTANGEMIPVHSPAIDPDDPTSESYRIDVEGSLIGSGLFTDEGFLVNGTTYIAPGSEFILESKSISVTVTILDITPISE